MPHNRTRFWVGLAIIAVTIPAVGTYYTHIAASSDLKGNPISAAGRIDLASLSQDSSGSGRLALHQPARDYQSEVNVALARRGAETQSRPDEDDSNDAYDEIFDVDPLDDLASDQLGRVSVTPDPAAMLAQGTPNLTVYSTDGPLTTAAVTPQNGATDDSQAANSAVQDQTQDRNASDDYGQSGGTMSDSDVYRLVLNNLTGTQRDDFVRAYAVMSAEQRADLLEGFRQQVQGR